MRFTQDIEYEVERYIEYEEKYEVLKVFSNT